jgi:hypothetical protein
MVASAACFATCSLAHAQATVRATLLAQVGSPTSGSGGINIQSTGQPYTDPAGAIGFSGVLVGGDGFVWHDGAIIHRNSQVTTHTLTGAETSVGVGGGGAFAMSPSIAPVPPQTSGGGDGIWTSAGYLASRTDPACPPGRFIANASSVSMFGATGVAWVSSMSSVAGGAVLPERVFYKCSSPAIVDCVCAVKAGDTIPDSANGAMLTVTTLGPGVLFDYDISEDGQQVVNLLNVVIPPEVNPANFTRIVAKNNAEVLRTGASVSGVATGPVANILAASIDNAGNVLVIAEVGGASALIYNGLSVAAEDIFIAGEPIGATAAIVAAGMSNTSNRAVHVWTYSDPFLGVAKQGVFFGIPSNLSQSSVLLLSQNDLLDFDNDGVGDAVVANLARDPSNSTLYSRKALDLGDDGRIGLELTITDVGGANPRKAIVTIASPPICDSVDFNGDGIFPDNQDVIDLIEVFAGGACPTGTCNDIDFNNDGIFPDNGDVVEYVDVFAGGACGG